jgi:hypothetical protein
LDKNIRTYFGFMHIASENQCLRIWKSSGVDHS